MSSSRPDTAATKRDVDSWENISKFISVLEATTYDNLLLDGSISNADVRGGGGQSGLHWIPITCINYKDIDTDILLSYLLTCDPPADVNGRESDGETPMWRAAALCKKNSAVKVLIDFGGDRMIKTISAHSYPNSTPLDIANNENNQDTIKLLTECFPNEE